MNINKDGKTLRFSDDEIGNNTNGKKKIYITKRINGEEKSFKIEDEEDKISKFNFDNEIVIGVNRKKGNNPKSYNKNNEKNNTKNNSKNKKKKRKKKKNHKLLKVIIPTISLISGGIIFALTAPIFNISSIEVKGNNKIPSETIISLSELKKGENIFRFNNKVKEKIKENNYIEEVEIQRNLPGNLLITVKEREVLYQIKLLNSYAYIDKNGYILEISSVKAEAPIILGFNITENELIDKKRIEVADLQVLKDILKISEAAKEVEIEKLITEINIENKENYVLYIESENKKIYLGEAKNLTNKMLYIKKMLENEKESSGTFFVNGDISEGFKPYFRPEM